MGRNDITYSDKSLINISSDNFVVNQGTVTRSGGVLQFGSNSRCTFSKSYSSNAMPVDSLKVTYQVLSELSSRYNNTISIQVKMQFYERDYQNGQYVYTDGKWQTVEIIPYNNSEEKGNYKFDEIETSGKYIKQLQVVIRYQANTGSATLSSLGIYNNVIDPDSVATAVNNYFDNGGTFQYLVVPFYDDFPDPATVPNNIIFGIETS